MHLKSQGQTQNVFLPGRPQSRSHSNNRRISAAQTSSAVGRAPSGPPRGLGGANLPLPTPSAPGRRAPGGNSGQGEDGGPTRGPPGQALGGAPPAASIQRGLIYVTDPFKCDINPATQNGLKLFLKATAKLLKEDLIDATQDYEKEFVKVIRTDAADFAWGRLIHRVQIDDLPTYKSLIRNYNEVTLLNVKQEALLTWGDKSSNFHIPFPNVMSMEILDPVNDIGDRLIFSRRVRSRMIAKRL